jgi:hypothetical protein
MKTFGTALIVLLLFVAPSIAAQSEAQGVLDFSELFKILRYRGLTMLEQQALVGNRYSGELWVYSVQRDKTGHVRLNCRIVVDNEERETLYLGMASFVMNDDDGEKAISLKKGYKVRLTGRLAQIQHPNPSDMRSSTEVARGSTEFIDVSLDEIVFKTGSDG